MSAASIRIDRRPENTRASPSHSYSPCSLSLLGQKIWLRRLASAHENIMSKHGSNRRRIGGDFVLHTVPSHTSKKAPFPWRSLSPFTLICCCSIILPLLPSSSFSSSSSSSHFCLQLKISGLLPDNHCNILQLFTLFAAQIETRGHVFEF